MTAPGSFSSYFSSRMTSYTTYNVTRKLLGSRIKWKEGAHCELARNVRNEGSQGDKLQEKGETNSKMKKIAKFSKKGGQPCCHRDAGVLEAKFDYAQCKVIETITRNQTKNKAVNVQHGVGNLNERE